MFAVKTTYFSLILLHEAVFCQERHYSEQKGEITLISNASQKVKFLFLFSTTIVLSMKLEALRRLFFFKKRLYFLLQISLEREA